MFVVYPDNLRNTAERILNEIRLRSEAYNKLQSACNALSNMSSMDEQVNRLKQQMKGLEEQISALCRLHSLVEEVRYLYERAERRVCDNAEGVRTENERIVSRQHMVQIVLPRGVRIMQGL